MLPASLTAFTLLAGLVAGQSALNPILPSDLAQCDTATLTWSSAGDDDTYSAKIVLSDTVGEPLVTQITWLGQFTGQTSLDWTVAVPAGSNITLRVADSQGVLGYSSPVVIADGGDSCLPDPVESRIGSAEGQAGSDSGMVGGTAEHASSNALRSRTAGLKLAVLAAALVALIA